MAVFTLETDYPSEMGYLLDNSRETDYTSSFENGTVLILDEQFACLYPSAYPSILTDFTDGLSISSGSKPMEPVSVVSRRG